MIKTAEEAEKKISLLELKDRIQILIDKYLQIKDANKKTVRYLFSKLDDLKEMELMERLSESFLETFLTYQQACYSNFEQKYLESAKFDRNKYLERVEQEIVLVEEKVNPPPKEITTQQLLTMLGEKIKSGEIKNNWKDFFDGDVEACSRFFITDEKGKEIMRVDLGTGEVKPNPIKEFVKKHTK